MADQAHKEPTVKVKMLRQAGPHAAGAVVEVSHADAEHLCAPSMQLEGNQTVNRQKAIRLEDEAKLKDMKIDVAHMTQVEMDAAGKKNVVPSPYDTHPAHVAKETEEQVAKIHKGHDHAAGHVDTAPAKADTVSDAKVAPKKK